MARRSETERKSWNQRYGRGQHLERDPNSFLLQAYRDFIAAQFPSPGTAVDVAGGTGRHSIWLAQRGWDVTLVDISDVGVKLALQDAAASGVKIRAIAADVLPYDFGREHFDVTLVFYFLERSLFPALTAALKPGGLIIYKTYTREHTKFRGCSHPMYFLEPGELRQAFSGFEILHYAEKQGIAELVGKKT